MAREACDLGASGRFPNPHPIRLGGGRDVLRRLSRFLERRGGWMDAAGVSADAGHPWPLPGLTAPLAVARSAPVEPVGAGLAAVGGAALRVPRRILAWGLVSGSRRRRLLGVIGLAVLVCVTSGCGGTPRRTASQGAPRLRDFVVRLLPGQTMRFSSTQLPARSIIRCVYRGNAYNYVVPPWSEWQPWDPALHRGWGAQGQRGVGEGWLGVRPIAEGRALLASCRR
jgi:hypothetical protein